MSTKKRGLGRGLGNFIKDSDRVEELLQPEGGELLKEIPLEEVFPNPNQPRRSFSEEAIGELAASIEEFGILQPLVLRKLEKGYEIVAGERRYRAAKKAGLSTVPGIVKEFSEEDADKVALIENVQREDLDPVEEATAYAEVMKKYDLTQEALGKILGKSRPYIANTVRLLKLDERVLDLLRRGELTVSHGKLLLSLKDKDEQYKKALEIIKEGSTIVETEVIIPRVKGKKPKDIYIADLEERIGSVLGTKVTVAGRGKKRKIEIEYYSDEDLERILEIMGVDYE